MNNVPAIDWPLQVAVAALLSLQDHGDLSVWTLVGNRVCVFEPKTAMKTMSHTSYRWSLVGELDIGVTTIRYNFS